jgi:hypothetical protein
MRFIKVLLLIVLFTCGLLFFIQNSKALETPLTLGFSFYYGDLTWTGKPLPFFVVVLAAFAIGALFSALYLFVDRLRLGCSLVKSKSDLRGKEKEIAKLRIALDKATPLDTQGSEVKKELPEANPTPA